MGDSNSSITVSTIFGHSQLCHQNRLGLWLSWCVAYLIAFINPTIRNLCELLNFINFPRPLVVSGHDGDLFVLPCPDGAV